MRIARVFPVKTNASPDDDLAFFGMPPLLIPPQVDEVHISCAFTWLKDISEYLAYQWDAVAPTRIGGPAYANSSGDFVPGMYLKTGYTITSRGCPNKCWFCSVWKREPKLIELPICDGYNVLDDNLLACSDRHIKKVFEMLARQKEKIEFTGGLEAKRLKQWHIEAIQKLRIEQMFFAYDTPDDEEPLRIAAKMLREAGYERHKLRCYVLVGYDGDSFEKAEKRLNTVIECGMFPMAMLYRNEKEPDIEWKKFQRKWVRPAIIYSREKNGT